MIDISIFQKRSYDVHRFGLRVIHSIIIELYFNMFELKFHKVTLYGLSLYCIKYGCSSDATHGCIMYGTSLKSKEQSRHSRHCVSSLTNSFRDWLMRHSRRRIERIRPQRQSVGRIFCVDVVTVRAVDSQRIIDSKQPLLLVLTQAKS